MDRTVGCKLTHGISCGDDAGGRCVVGGQQVRDYVTAAN